MRTNAPAWLISPTKAAGSTRKFLAVPYGRYPGAVYAVLGLVAFIFAVAVGVTMAASSSGYCLSLFIDVGIAPRPMAETVYGPSFLVCM